MSTVGCVEVSSLLFWFGPALLLVYSCCIDCRRVLVWGVDWLGLTGRMGAWVDVFGSVVGLVD